MRLSQARSVLAHSPALAADVLKPGAPVGSQNAKKGEKIKVDHVNFNSKGGNRAAYLASILKRDRPDIAAAVERGEYRLRKPQALSVRRSSQKR
jgi:hypothetical protein